MSEEGAAVVEEAPRMTEEELWRILDEVPYCFCLKCKHQKEYGPCDQCWCKNASASKTQEGGGTEAGSG
jgi:hypothetical protein